jgi:hypothetical protein
MTELWPWLVLVGLGPIRRVPFKSTVGDSLRKQLAKGDIPELQLPAILFFGAGSRESEAMVASANSSNSRHHPSAGLRRQGHRNL